MSWKSLLHALHLKCLVFMTTALLATSEVAAYNSHSVCYNSKQEKVKCTKKEGIIIGVVVGVVILLLGTVYLYGVWKDRRKRSSTAEENAPLSCGLSTASDYEKGVGEENVGDHGVSSSQHRSQGSVSDTSSVVSGRPSYSGPPGITRPDPPSTRL